MKHAFLINRSKLEKRKQLLQSNIVNNQKKKEDKDLPYVMYEFEAKERHITFYISDNIGDPIDYTDMCYSISMAGPNDVIYLHLNTSGGRVDTGVQIINAIRSTEAHVITIVEAQAHSMGALLFLAGDELVIHDNCLVMFHNYSGGLVGKGNEQLAEIKSTSEWYKKLMKDICQPFLKESEISDILEGKDIWMDSDEIKTRLESYKKELEEREAKKQQSELIDDNDNKDEQVNEVIEEK